ncbi:MAG TPA: NAD(P)-binding protein [Terriglobales bacterium]|nr:NAD(P)-binding protein [Terriglobales bacterium]
MDPKDRALGMHRDITRRDFLNGIALTVGATLLPSQLFPFVNDENSPAYYPPALTGLRGSHVGSFEAAHSLRDGDFWNQAGPPIDTRETYDLIIVGGGISGLAAARYFRKAAGPRARVLIIENHDDFGGHAKRNEFRVGNRTLLGYGGTYAIESPAPYSPIAKSLVEELGIDVPGFQKYVTKNLYRSLGLNPKIFFDKETFGADKLVINPAPLAGGETDDQPFPKSDAWKTFMAEAAISERARQDIFRLHHERKDYLPDLSSDEKKARLARMSYAKFLTDLAGVNQEVIRLYQAAPQPLFGVGIDAVSAQDAWGLGLPGFDAMKLDPAPGKGMNRDAIRNEEAERYFFHFPDGNASIARLLVRQLIPDAIPGSSSSDMVTAKTNYAKLDESSAPIRIRLNSTAVRVKHVGDPASAKEVEITYARRGRAYSVRGKNCVLACWHAVIPYICEELPDTQKEALASAAKVPLLYTNVVLRNWTAFEKLGVNSVYAPGSYHTFLNLDNPVSIGDYHCSRKPEEPIVVHMVRTPCKPGLPARLQHGVGRAELFGTPFETMERKIRDQMARTLRPGGFDPARDIVAITVNRWPHGYAYEYNSLWDKFWLEGGETPCEVARKPFGRLAIANADAAAYAYTDAAIDQAYRAVQEITRRG